jgi:hypothetical protein
MTGTVYLAINDQSSLLYCLQWNETERIFDSTKINSVSYRFTYPQVLLVRHLARSSAAIQTHSRPSAILGIHTSPPKMSSDADYEAFLDKANKDSNEAKATSQSKSKSAGTKAVNASVPKGLEKVDEFFTSESDEPFEPVSLKYDGDKVPSAGW